MPSNQPYLVGIAGPSASGKSSLARALVRRYAHAPLLFPVDAFYHDLAHLDATERAGQNFDHPDAIDWPYLLLVLDALRRGEAVEAPVYDFTAHTRSALMTHLEPAPVIILEGLHVLQQEPLRDLLDAALYLDCPRAVCLTRRMARDTAERGRSKAEIREQFQAHAWPMAEQFVLPSRKHAGLSLDGTETGDVIEEVAAAWLEGTLSGFAKAVKVRKADP